MFAQFWDNVEFLFFYAMALLGTFTFFNALAEYAVIGVPFWKFLPFVPDQNRSVIPTSQDDAHVEDLEETIYERVFALRRCRSAGAGGCVGSRGIELRDIRFRGFVIAENDLSSDEEEDDPRYPIIRRPARPNRI
ncbi:hypothetical protein K501DRAFT_276784 [Backusella circina FSU 941]|nr:hypothetical protein K501DRAFT_276784 [Backusella circina FSU 941]